MSSSDFASTIRKLEDLPSDGGRAVDTIAGALLRIFIRLNEIEAAQARLGRRVAALEGPQPDPARAGAASSPNEELAVTKTMATAPSNEAVPPKPRGRPPGSRNRLNNGHEVEART
jgi:hypothetical protein